MAKVAEPEVASFAGTEDAEEFFTEPLPRPKPSDPTMDPGDPRWNPQKYFAAQPQEIVVVSRDQSDVLGDPTGSKVIKQPVSINGYLLNITKGVPTRVPRDFAEQIVRLKIGYRIDDIPALG